MEPKITKNQPGSQICPSFTNRLFALPRSTTGQKGFAMLFTVLLVSLILSIAISISNITLKQSILSNLVKDSQISFYQADSAIECGIYQDVTLEQFPLDANSVPNSFYCGNTMLVLQQDQMVNYYTYKFLKPYDTEPCYSITFDKTYPSVSKIEGYGYNLCGANSRQVERTLELTY